MYINLYKYVYAFFSSISSVACNYTLTGKKFYIEKAIHDKMINNCFPQDYLCKFLKFLLHF